MDSRQSKAPAIAGDQRQGHQGVFTDRRRRPRRPNRTDEVGFLKKQRKTEFPVSLFDSGDRRHNRWVHGHQREEEKKRIMGRGQLPAFRRRPAATVAPKRLTARRREREILRRRARFVVGDSWWGEEGTRGSSYRPPLGRKSDGKSDFPSGVIGRKKTPFGSLLPQPSRVSFFFSFFFFGWLGRPMGLAQHGYYNLCGFYFHLATGEYRLLAGVSRIGFEVHALGTNACRGINASHSQSYVLYTEHSLAVHGNLHWVGAEGIIAFDMDSEEFSQMLYPAECNASYQNHIIIMAESLGLCKVAPQTRLEIWILKDHERKLWIKRYTNSKWRRNFAFVLRL